MIGSEDIKTIQENNDTLCMMYNASRSFRVNLSSQRTGLAIEGPKYGGVWMKLSKVLVVAIVLLIGVAAFGATIKVALVAPFTGLGSILGDYIKMGAQLADRKSVV